MPSLRAWVQGSGEPAYRQVVQRPLPQCVREGLESGIADLVRAQVQIGQLVQCPALNCLSESGEPCVANVVAVQH